MQNSSKNSLNSSSWQDKILPILSITLVMISFLSPIIIKQISHIPQTSSVSCPNNSETRYFRHYLGSSINLVFDEEIIDSHLPNIKISDFRKGLKTFAPWLTKEPEAFAKLTAGLTILDTDNKQWLIVKSNLIPQEQGLILACGKLETIGELKLFYANYLQSLSSQF